MWELLVFMKSNFKLNIKHKLLPLVMGSNIFLKKIYLDAD